MADFPDIAKRQLGFFHGLSKVPTESSQYVYESKYKSAHSVRSIDIWTDNIAYAADRAAADSEAAVNSAVTKYELQSLSMIPGSNGQSWYLEVGGKFIRPFISPVDVPHPTTNEPSYGYEIELFQQNDTLITPTEGAWVVDYYAGIIKFAEGYTPDDLGWGNPKVTCYVYTGETGDSLGNAEEIERVTLDLNMITDKRITLQHNPIDGRKILAFVDDGIKGEINIDYEVTNNILSWDGLGWDGLLEINDKITVLYWY